MSYITCSFIKLIKFKVICNGGHLLSTIIFFLTRAKIFATSEPAGREQILILLQLGAKLEEHLWRMRVSSQNVITVPWLQVLCVLHPKQTNPQIISSPVMGQFFALRHGINRY